MKTVNKKEKQKSKNEIRIFKNFTELCPYSIVPDSIINKKPPEPDILCKLLDGTNIAFELAISTDESFTKLSYLTEKMEKIFYEKIEKLPKNKKEKFKNNFKNAEIFINFNKQLLKAKINTIILKIIEHLLNLENKYEGKVLFPSTSDLKSIIHVLNIFRKNIEYPNIRCVFMSSISNPFKEVVKRKFLKNYETSADKIELILYYADIFGYPYLEKTEEFIKNNIKTSEFKRVWIYSVTSNKIKFVCPKL